MIIVDWTDEKNDEKLRAQYALGLSYTKIAAFIPGATRNSIAGRVHRLGLPKRRKASENGPQMPPRAPAVARRAA